MKFAHISDSHLGGWRQPEMQFLNMESFKKAIESCIEQKVEFVLFTGDLFDSPFPPIEILKETFSEFRRLKEAGIKSYVIAGSHDYSVSGKTFLDVLEKSGFCEICKFEETETKVILKPIMHKSFYIYGYPGKKSGLELNSLKKIEIAEPYSNYFRILMLHTTIKEAIENIPIDSIPLNELPKADYYALGHVHINFEKEINDKPAVYGGPTFPNNFKELEDLKYGAFYIIEIEGYTKVIRKEIRLKEVELIEVEIEDALRGTEQILEILKRLNLKDRIVLLKVFGELKRGKLSDIKFQEIQDYLEKNGVYCFLKNTSRLEAEKKEIEMNIPSHEMEKIEEVLVQKYDKENPSNLNKLIFPLIEHLSLEKQEGENSSVFESRLFSGLNKILGMDL
ncbi:MAG: exonuclease SbcCD subunit D [Candidatus Nanoarchaeia archaeon]|nr:exonuclease SbcCD subunit D [Candidatus Nanoarchaeia archaeon]